MNQAKMTLPIKKQSSLDILYFCALYLTTVQAVSICVLLELCIKEYCDIHKEKQGSEIDIPYNLPDHFDEDL